MTARVRHLYPLRAGAYLAQVMLPPDMTHAEAERLCEFVRSLAGRSAKPGTSQARAENRFFAETRPERAAAVKLWSVRFEVVTLLNRTKPRTHMRRILVASKDEYSAAKDALAAATDLKDAGHVLSVRWLDTKLSHLPVDMSEMETPATARAGGRGYQAGLVAGFRAGMFASTQGGQDDDDRSG
jgi:hypothetical protein